MMRLDALSSLVVATLLAFSVNGQFTPWPEEQANTTICSWYQPRAALINDTVYLDGGRISWLPGLKNGIYGPRKGELNTQGYILSYKLSRPFSSDTNVTGILVKDKISKAPGNNGVASGSDINSQDGALLANYHQFFFYGGITTQADGAYVQPNPDEVSIYRVSQYGANKAAFRDGIYVDRLKNDVNRWVAYGGAASAPSENKAWYFSGLTSESKGPIYSNYDLDNSTKADVISDRLITVDMAQQFSPEWSNTTIGSKGVRIKGRANPELVWVPVGKEGILVVLGGVIFPDWAGRAGKSLNVEASEKESPQFMQTIDIYDVASKKWFQQPTKGGPQGPRTRGCAVVAPSSDFSSFNIYYYGGYDGLHPEEPFYDDVWVLSMPSFTWVRLDEGTAIHGRAGHKCLKPYSDQMMVFGGSLPLTGKGCLKDGPVVIFNLTSGKWMDSYDPTRYAEYGVPEMVYKAIGGDATGKATKTKPADGWETEELGEIFGQDYDQSKIQTLGPYPAETTDPGRPNAPPPDDDGNGKSGLPSWVAPVLGVVIGLILLTGAIVLFCLWRKRKLFFKKRDPSEPGTEDPHSRIANWMRGQPTPQPAVEKAPTVTTSELMPEGTPEIGHAHEVTAYSVRPREYYAPPGPNSHFHEMGDTQVMELDGSPRPAELGFTHVALNRRQSNKLTNPSSVSGNHSDLNDNVSQASGPIASGPVAEPGLVDSPTLAQSPADATNPTTHYASGVSMMSNAASHSRNISNTTVSSEGTHGEPRVAPERMSQPGVQSIPERLENQNNQLDEGFRASSGPLPPFEGPVSPPTEGEVHADEYFSAKQLVSPIVKNESDEERPLGRK